MQKLLRCITLGLVLTLIIGCASSKKVKREPEEAAAKATTDSLTQARQGELTDDERDALRKVMEAIEDVPFDFNSYGIPTQGMDIVRKNITLLNQMLQTRGKYIRVTLEGHCDERGSTEYNLALGERRAKTVQQYLKNAGFSEKSLKVISFGEERPTEPGHTEEAWAANRRVHLVAE